MTCKDCLHFKVCEYEGIYFEDWAIEASSADGIEDLCPQFENKADFVEVVRCKDCIYYKPQQKSKHWNCRSKYCTREATTKVSDLDFCSYGQRK